jgi:formate-nitrite transporter family protein
VVALGRFPHIIAGSTEAAYAVIVGLASLSDYLMKFMIPTLIGNVIGGMALVGLLNHASVAHDIRSPPGSHSGAADP